MKQRSSPDFTKIKGIWCILKIITNKNQRKIIVFKNPKKEKKKIYSVYEFDIRKKKVEKETMLKQTK